MELPERSLCVPVAASYEIDGSTDLDSMRTRAKLGLIVVLGITLGVGYETSHGHWPRGANASSSPGQQASSALPVQTALSEARNVPIIVRGLGTVTAFNMVSVKSRVQGNITQVNFREGQEVHTGDLLVQIDPRPYQAVLDQAQATLTKDQANLANAQKDLGRYADLLKRNFAPEQQFATQQATVSEDEAALKGDQAQIDSARLNVDYAAIRSPIDGVTGIRQVDLGNLVQANNGQTLVVITQIKPIYVVFTVPEADITEVREAMAQGTLAAEAFDASDEHRIASGTLKLVDNQVDQTTGTVKLKAEFANTDEKLWPGAFVNAHLVLSVAKDGITVPADAVQTGPTGSFAYVVKPNDTVEQRVIRVRQTERDRALVASGLQVGERVVTGGQSRLRAGMKVTVADAAPSPATPMAAR